MKPLGFAAASRETGPVGPVSFFALIVLIVLAPLMRGGNRQVALIVLEAIALVVLVGVAVPPQRWAGLLPQGATRWPLLLLVSSPLWLAVVYLLPIPGGLWSAMGGREAYVGLLDGAGIEHGAWLPLSLVPDATAVSLAAGIPIAAAFAGGYLARLSQLRVLLGAFVILAFLQIGMGLLQMATGSASFLYFGGYGGRPMGTFGNPNHFANYVALALAAYVWLAWSRITQARLDYGSGKAPGPMSRNVIAVWFAGGVLLMLGVLMSRSRGAALGGLLGGLFAFGLAMTLGAKRSPRWQTVVFAMGAAIAAAVAMVGLNSVVSRFELGGLSSAASLRGMLASDTFDGAAFYWPWGAGWGTYAVVFPRFQSPAVVGFAEYAHHDYAQLLFEGGAFAVLLMAAFAWLAAQRTLVLVRTARRRGRLGRLEMTSAICGLGVFGFLVHSIVDFSMHIPANAIAAALVAGAFLRPMRDDDESPE